MSSNARATAQILTEALPYIRRYQGKTIVIKYGGHAQVGDSPADADLRRSFARDVILMKLVGMQPVIVHGGGPQIGATLKKIGKESAFIDGLRVTDAETMEVVEMVLGGLVNKSIVQLINSLGGRAVGLSGKDGGLIRARKLRGRRNTPRPEEVDYGQVGEVESIDPRVVQLLQTQSFIPVIAPIGADADGQTYNINADLVAGEMAVQLRAEKLILLTNTRGVLDPAGNLTPELDAAAVATLVQTGQISGGMIPKAECAVAAVQGGVGSALILDGRVAHALLLELFTDAGVGTRIRGRTPAAD